MSEFGKTKLSLTRRKGSSITRRSELVGHDDQSIISVKMLPWTVLAMFFVTLRDSMSREAHEDESSAWKNAAWCPLRASLELAVSVVCL
jgi:hypothetical protein